MVTSTAASATGQFAIATRPTDSVCYAGRRQRLDERRFAIGRCKSHVIDATYAQLNRGEQNRHLNVIKQHSNGGKFFVEVHCGTTMD
jgi:hypothetical protein